MCACTDVRPCRPCRGREPRRRQRQCGLTITASRENHGGLCRRIPLKFGQFAASPLGRLQTGHFQAASKSLSVPALMNPRAVPYCAGLARLNIRGRRVVVCLWEWQGPWVRQGRCLNRSAINLISSVSLGSKLGVLTFGKLGRLSRSTLAKVCRGIVGGTMLT